MKWLIAADLHGSALYTKKLLEAFTREEAGRLLLLGDLLYHGPRNDLPEGYAPKQVIALLNPLASRIHCVRGNCEAEVDQMVLDFPVLPESCLLAVAGRLLYATHGHVYNLEHPPKLHHGDILLHGHTHVPAKAWGGDFWYLNPGSVSLPKQDSPHSYMTLEDGCFTWKTLEGVAYDRLRLEGATGETEDASQGRRGEVSP